MNVHVFEGKKCFVILVAHAMQNLLQNYRFAINVRVQVRNDFLKNAHVRDMCVVAMFVRAA